MMASTLTWAIQPSLLDSGPCWGNGPANAVITVRLIAQGGNLPMKYMFAWLLGVPGFVIVIWFLLSHH
jgi:hypothetical protein